MRNACIMFYPNVSACMLLACILRQTAMQLTRAPSALQQSCLAFPFPSLAPSIACLTSSPIIKSVASNMQTLRRRKHLCRLLHSSSAAAVIVCSRLTSPLRTNKGRMQMRLFGYMATGCQTHDTHPGYSLQHNIVELPHPPLRVQQAVGQNDVLSYMQCICRFHMLQWLLPCRMRYAHGEVLHSQKALFQWD